MSADITVRPMSLEDLNEIIEIEHKCFTIPWSKSAFEQELSSNEHAFYFVALFGGKIAGYCGMWHIINEGHITNIAVSGEFRGNGIGQRLMDELLRTALDLEMIGITLEVRVSNYSAQRLYMRNGFKPEGFRKNYYEDTKEDAIIMWKHLDAVHNSELG